MPDAGPSRRRRGYRAPVPSPPRRRSAPRWSGARWAALGLVLGPAAFITAWAVAGTRMPTGFSPVDDAISRTAAVGAPPRRLMTAGFLLDAAGSAAGSLALRRAVPGPAWAASAVNGAATIGVALTPLDSWPAVEVGHTLTATAGYASLALTPLLAARPLARAGHTGLARVSTATAVAVGAGLAATVVWDEASGLLQRVGITVGDAWLIAAGLAILAGRTLRSVDGATEEEVVPAPA